MTPFDKDTRAADIDREYSVACTSRNQIPSYVLTSLPLYTRQSLPHHLIQDRTILHANLDGSMYFLFDNGLEFRLEKVHPTTLNAGAFYHIPTWAMKTLPARFGTAVASSIPVPLETHEHKWSDIESRSFFPDHS